MIDGGSDDEGASTEAHGRAIVNILGAERRNEVLAAVYMVRSDVSLAVRQVQSTRFSMVTNISCCFTKYVQNLFECMLPVLTLQLYMLCSTLRHRFMFGRLSLLIHQKH